MDTKDLGSSSAPARLNPSLWLGWWPGLAVPLPPEAKGLQGQFGVSLGSVQGEGAPEGQIQLQITRPPSNPAGDGGVTAVQEQREQKSGFGLRLPGWERQPGAPGAIFQAAGACADG